MRGPVLFKVRVLFSCQNVVKPSMPVTVNFTSIETSMFMEIREPLQYFHAPTFVPLAHMGSLE